MVFVALHLSESTWDATVKWGYYPDKAILEGSYWALVTSAFVHIEPLHLLFNLYWFWILGGAFEKTFGPVQFFLFVVFSAFVSSGLEFLLGETGIGLSGVGYALFGFAWMTRGTYHEFGRIVNDRVVQLFLLWALICIVATYAGLMNIANVAHVGGCAFGVCLGAAIVRPRARILWGAGMIALTVLSLLPLFWNPLSVDWVSLQAWKRHRAGDNAGAIRYYERSLELDGDAEWAWTNLTMLYGRMKRRADYDRALEELRRLNPERAEDLSGMFD